MTSMKWLKSRHRTKSQSRSSHREAENREQKAEMEVRTGSFSLFLS